MPECPSCATVCQQEDRFCRMCGSPLRAQGGSRAQERARELFRLGNRCAREHDYAGALRYYDAALAEDPHDYRVWHNKAVVHRRLGDLPLADHCAARAEDLRQASAATTRGGVPLAAGPAASPAGGVRPAAPCGKKDPALAAALSLFFPGLGHVYNGEPGWGAAFLAGRFAALFLLAVGALAVAVLDVYLAWKTARRMNAGEISVKSSPKWVMVLFAVAGAIPFVLVTAAVVSAFAPGLAGSLQ